MAHSQCGMLPGLRALKLDYDASSSQNIFTQLQQLKSADVIKQVSL